MWHFFYQKHIFKVLLNTYSYLDAVVWKLKIESSNINTVINIMYRVKYKIIIMNVIIVFIGSIE